MKRLTANVHGRVQGVFFRHSARIRAAELSITGWIRNEENGSVALAAEGPEEALEKFLAWCREGPPLARVDSVKVAWQDATGEFKSFDTL